MDSIRKLKSRVSKVNWKSKLKNQALAGKISRFNETAHMLTEENEEFQFQIEVQLLEAD